MMTPRKGFMNNYQGRINYGYKMFLNWVIVTFSSITRLKIIPENYELDDRVLSGGYSFCS